VMAARREGDPPASACHALQKFVRSAAK
jgi:hypothetical protein